MKPKNHKNRIMILLFLLLAALCIGGAELAACRFFAPELYAQITAPVRRGMTVAAELCRGVSLQTAQLLEHMQEELTALHERMAASEEENPASLEEQGLDFESQLATEPILVTDQPISDPSVTEIIILDSQEVLTGGLVDVVYFNQTDEIWADQPYGRDKIGGYGCGPTAMAMAIASMTGEQTDPAVMAQWAVSHGYWASRSGSYHTIVEGTARAFGLEAASFSGRTVAELQDAILADKMLVALMGPGHFTNRGHFILLRGVTLTGDILVADPASRDRSLVAWDPQLILDELSASTSGGAPLWEIALP